MDRRRDRPRRRGGRDRAAGQQQHSRAPGSYGHELKNIALDSQDRLFVAIASSCNVCVSDEADPVRGSVYVYAATGGDGRLYARTPRNAEGLAFFPGTVACGSR